MPIYTCDITGCSKPVVRGPGMCRLCRRHLCILHLDASFHKCPHWSTDEDAYYAANSLANEDELKELFARINVKGLTARVSQLRNGMQCIIAPLIYDAENNWELMGGMNFHIPINFSDGVVWLCRIRRRNISTPPEAAQDLFLLSEVATYKFLSGIAVPVPKVYDYATASSPSNNIGMGYMIIEKCAGKPLDWRELDISAKTKVLQQLADIFIAIKNHPFPLIGSLTHPEDLTVGPIASYNSDTFDVDKDADGYLALQYLLENAPHFSRNEEARSSQFYLKHMDDKGDHILVDDANNIVSIIDWEFAQTTPASAAFSAPLFLLNVSAYYNGVNGLSADEELWASILERKGHPDLAVFVREGRREHRFAHCGESSKETWDSWKADALLSRNLKKDTQLLKLLA
ncbi:hypothetical protein M422DRAFT_73901 [Sphaerobolus stellatus SS14]|nr:hypothetical protein M422DRAFT_73901 [Sphaerobolus stellatus SS14]